MHQTAAILLLFLAGSGMGAYEQPSPNQWCVSGCSEAVGSNIYAGQSDGTEDIDYYINLCTNEVHVSSLWACARKYCTPDELQDGWHKLSKDCLDGGGIDILPPSIIDNLTDQDIDNLPMLEYAGADVVNVTSLVNATIYAEGYRTTADWVTQTVHHTDYAHAMFIFWGIVIGIGALSNAFHHFGPRISHPWVVKAHTTLFIAPYTALQGDGSRPPLAETLVNAAFIAVNVILCFVNYNVGESIYWTMESQQIWRYISDRTGYIAYANLSILWFFGIRNDILIWLTGWSFATFSRFHRAVAFICTVEAIMHSIGYTVGSSYYGAQDYIDSFTYQYWRCGVAATIAMSFAVVLSITWLRVKWYDFFLVAHIVLAIIVLVMLFYHTEIFNGEFDPYLWPCVALWGFDRVVRVGRIVLNASTAKSKRCLIEYDEDADLVRIDATDALGTLGKASQGSHYYMYLVKRPRFYESHPFTLTRWKSADEGSGSSWCYSFVIRPYDGFTRSMAKSANNGPVTRTCLFEGPYGAEPSLLRAKDGLTEYLFIIGGSGISVAISAIYTLLEKHESNTNFKIKLVWSVRNHAFLATVLDRELRHARHRIDLEAYVTQNTTAVVQQEDSRGQLKEKEIDIGTDSGENSDSNSNIGLDLGFTYGRPDIRRSILDATKDTRGRVAVVTCGPHSMVRDVKSAVVEANRDGVERATLFAEDFSW